MIAMLSGNLALYISPHSSFGTATLEARLQGFRVPTRLRSVELRVCRMTQTVITVHWPGNSILAIKLTFLRAKT
jgi:hypothetical protein